MNNVDKVNYMIADSAHFSRQHPDLSQMIAAASLQQINEIAKHYKEALGFSDALPAQERALDLQFGNWVREARGLK